LTLRYHQLYLKFSQDELNKDLRALFEPFGKIKEIVIKTKQGSSNSYVFVEYEDVESATKAQIEYSSTKSALRTLSSRVNS
jgi:RNA recognition motif-containing protein